MKPVIAIAILAAATLPSVASSTSTSTDFSGAKSAYAECKERAKSRHFGIHSSKRKRWIKDCIATANRLLSCQDAPVLPKVCSLMNFDPTPRVGYTSPSCTSPDPTGAQIIQDAFNLAPAKLKTDLCSLKYIFTISDRASWGKWEDSTFDPKTDDTFIAVNVEDLNNGLANKQDENLKALKITGASHQDMPSGTTSARLALLYVLAHEMGHIKWHQWSRDNAKITCLNAFSKLTWSDLGAPPNQGRWTEFGASFSAGRNTVPDNNNANMVQVPDPNSATPAAVQTIYTHGVTTALGAANPEEDFVEIYSMGAIMKGSPQSTLDINIGGNVIHVLEDRGHDHLKKKFQCVSGLLQ